MKNQEKFKNAFLQKAKDKFGDKFDYSKMDYQGMRTQIEIICPEHGSFFMTPTNHLKSETGCKRCSCSKPKKAVIEGVRRKDMREYHIWKAMKTRVTNVNTKTADSYVLKGISCCDEWFNSFEQFYKDMGPCPEGYSIDRIDPNGNYCPENCRWASKKEQADNRGDFNKVFEYEGEAHVLKDWARKLNIKYSTLYSRIYRSGMSFEDAIKEEVANGTLIEINGEKHTIIEWCQIYDIPTTTVYTRRKRGWDAVTAITTPKLRN